MPTATIQPVHTKPETRYVLAGRKGNEWIELDATGFTKKEGPEEAIDFLDEMARCNPLHGCDARRIMPGSEFDALQLRFGSALDGLRGGEFREHQGKSFTVLGAEPVAEGLFNYRVKLSTGEVIRIPGACVLDVSSPEGGDGSAPEAKYRALSRFELVSYAHARAYRGLLRKANGLPPRIDIITRTSSTTLIAWMVLADEAKQS